MPQGNPTHSVRIECVRMRKVYYTCMRILSLAVPFVAVAISACLCTGSAPQSGTPRSIETSSLESHEGLTISARPWTAAGLYKEAFPKKSPYSAGILAIHVAFRNDSNYSLKVSLDRIRLSFHIDEDNRQEVQALTAEQVADEILKPGGKDPTKRSKIPLPVSIPKTSKDKQWHELQQQAEIAGVPASVIAPHSTVQGLLYFDMQGQFDLLSGAHLYIPDVNVMESNRSLTYFEIDLSHAAAK
jgi:hypothetical protein